MRLLRNMYLRNRLFMGVFAVIVAFILSFVLKASQTIPQMLFIILVGILLTDLILLFSNRNAMYGRRIMKDKLSNGDENEIDLHVESKYAFRAYLEIIDEIPFQFQRRDLVFHTMISPGESKVIRYTLRPVKRGEYSFAAVNVFVSSRLGLVTRRFRFSNNTVVPVYPSYIQMRKYELLAISNSLTMAGIKKIRKIGHNMEFEQIKEYVGGDDVRTLNWKATARKRSLMVNHYQDEKSQQVYSLIDKGRVMEMPFEGMSLLDYAINASLVISNIAIKKSDKAGLLTFQDNIGTFLPAARQSNQMYRIMEMLYNQKTGYRESDFSVLHNFVKRKITQRSLLLLYTNFESIFSLHRQISFLKSLARQHLLVVIFFENTETYSLLERPAKDIRGIYHKAIAEKFVMEKKLIVKELQGYGIQALLTPPQQLSVNTINKYLELKARGMI